jgi:uncharacterized protein (TIGR02444 family)
LDRSRDRHGLNEAHQQPKHAFLQMTESGSLGSPFWRFSVRFYREPGVADACIALQDDCCVDVNILLFLLWLATERRRVPLAAVQGVCADTAAWHREVVVPLRTLRRRLKDGVPLIERGAAELFRTRIKAAELESERLQQEALHARAAGLATVAALSVKDAARASVAAYEQAIGRAFTPAAVARLVEALSPEQAAATGQG